MKKEEAPSVTPNPRRSPNRQKTLTLKGKEKIKDEEVTEDEDDPTVDRTCGICLSDASHWILGRIDSCQHRFCFLCIMEWARMETRCPMCKQRFRSIRRPSGRFVNLPERNQVYHPLGNESVTPFDPYADVFCSECHSAQNEELLLLCDICDSASHTYCVGLGATVPEGDWYCHDCAIIKSEQIKTQIDSDSCINDSYNRLKAVPASEPPVSIRDIPSDIDSSSHQRDGGRPTRNPVSQGGAQRRAVHVSIFDIVSDTDSSNHRRDGGRPSRNPLSQGGPQGRAVPVEEALLSSPARIELSARTLRRSRNVQNHIRVLRQNWNALRSGALSFSSTIVDTSHSDRVERKKAGTINSNTARQPDSTSSVQREQSVDATVPRKANDSAGSKDVSKAWKNMKIANSIQGARSSAASTSAEAGPTEAEACRRSSSLAEKRKPLYHGKESLEVHRSKKTQNDEKGLTKTPRSGPMKPSFPKLARNSLQEGTCDEKKGLASSQLYKELAIGGGRDIMNCGDSTKFSLSRPCNLVASNPAKTFRCRVETSNGENAVASADGSLIRSNQVVNNNAKGDIQSLVKLNLKLLGGDRLDASKFKEVARFATHTILAACGLENSKSIPLPSSPICKHPEEAREHRKSNLMPNSCRECFFSYVKDVVNSILLEKMGNQFHQSNFSLSRAI